MGGLYEWANMMNIASTYATTWATPTPISLHKNIVIHAAAQVECRDFALTIGIYLQMQNGQL